MTDWTNNFYTGVTTSAGTSTLIYDFITPTETYLPDPLIDWVPYKIEKYIPTWHLMRSYKK